MVGEFQPGTVEGVTKMTQAEHTLALVMKAGFDLGKAVDIVLAGTDGRKPIFRTYIR